MSRRAGIDRRAFLVRAAAAGGALTLGFAVPFGAPRARAENGAPEITAWIVIEPDDTVIIRVAKAEMGQGAFTALPMLVAEELECDWRKVKPEFVHAHENARRGRVWGNMSTGASRAISSSQQDLRRAGATAREMLIAAAAARWNVPPAECTAANSVITHRPTGRNVTFAAVAAAAAAMPAPQQVRLKDPKRLEADRYGRNRASRSATRSPGSRSTPSTCACRTCCTPRSCSVRCSRAG